MYFYTSNGKYIKINNIETFNNDIIEHANGDILGGTPATDTTIYTSETTDLDTEFNSLIDSFGKQTDLTLDLDNFDQIDNSLRDTLKQNNISESIVDSILGDTQIIPTSFDYSIDIPSLLQNLLNKDTYSSLNCGQKIKLLGHSMNFLCSNVINKIKLKIKSALISFKSNINYGIVQNMILTDYYESQGIVSSSLNHNDKADEYINSFQNNILDNFKAMTKDIYNAITDENKKNTFKEAISYLKTEVIDNNLLDKLAEYKKIKQDYVTNSNNLNTIKVDLKNDDDSIISTNKYIYKCQFVNDNEYENLKYS